MAMLWSLLVQQVPVTIIDRIFIASTGQIPVTNKRKTLSKEERDLVIIYYYTNGVGYLSLCGFVHLSVTGFFVLTV